MTTSPRVDDWRNLTPSVVAPWYEQEQARWSRVLDWDIRTGLEDIERARRAGGIPGFAAIDPLGRLVGLTFFTIHAGTLRIGALTAGQATTIRELLERVIEAPESSLVTRYQSFLFTEGSALETALQRRRFAVERYSYLVKTMNGDVPQPSTTGLRRWRDQDAPAMVRLLARAYAGSQAAKSFAPGGRLEEWAGYLAEVVRTISCGTFSADESLVVEDDRHQLVAAVLVTRVSSATGHVAQLVVDPTRHREGWGRRLLHGACVAIAARGGRQVSLLVGESNAGARALYAGARFVERASFIAAGRERISRARFDPLHAAAGQRV